MKKLSLGGVALCTLAALGCSSGEKDPDAGPQAAINIAPLELDQIASITFLITMEYNDPSDAPDAGWITLWSTVTTGNPYGNGTQYIGPCVAGAAGINRVTVSIVSAFDTGGDPVLDLPPAAVNSSFPCVENADTPVPFEFTLIHGAGQGFTDITYDIDEVFCSMKGDCLDAFLPDDSPSGGVTYAGECSQGEACEPTTLCWDGSSCPATAEVLGHCAVSGLECSPTTACAANTCDTGSGLCTVTDAAGNPTACAGDGDCPANGCSDYQAATSGSCPPEACTDAALDCPAGATCDGVVTTSGHVQGDRAPTVVTAIVCTGGGEENVQTEVGIHDAIVCCGTGGVIDPTLDGCVSFAEASAGTFPAVDVNPVVSAEFYDGSEDIENKEFSNTAWQLDIDWLAGHVGETCTVAVQAYVNWTEDGTAPPTTYQADSLGFAWYHQFVVGPAGTPFSKMCGQFGPRPVYADMFSKWDRNGGRDTTGKESAAFTNEIVSLAAGQVRILQRESLGVDIYNIDNSYAGGAYKDLIDYHAIALGDALTSDQYALELSLTDVRDINGDLIGYDAVKSVSLWGYNANLAAFEEVKSDIWQTKFEPALGITSLFVSKLAAGIYYVRVDAGDKAVGSYTLYAAGSDALVDGNAFPRSGEATYLGYLPRGMELIHSEQIGFIDPYVDAIDCFEVQPAADANQLTYAIVEPDGQGGYRAKTPPDGYKINFFNCEGKELAAQGGVIRGLAEIARLCQVAKLAPTVFGCYGTQDKLSAHRWYTSLKADL